MSGRWGNADARDAGDVARLRALLPLCGDPVEDGAAAATGGVTPLMAAAAGGKFGRMPPTMGIPSARYPELIAELQAAVRDGVPRSEGDILRALGMGPSLR
jgi:hypothetical protein